MAKFKCIIFITFLFTQSITAQIHFESQVFEKLGKPFLNNASSVDISPDGQFLYVSSYDDDAISVFQRNTDGSIVFVETQKNEVAGISGLKGSYEVKVSPDNRHVYATGKDDNAIVYFSKDEMTGRLTMLGKYQDDSNGIDGLEGAYLMDFTPDGNYLYVVGQDENAVAVFARNVLDGSLSLVQVVRNNQNGNNHMNFPVSVKVSPDGRQVLVTSYANNAVTWFNRNSNNGNLTYAGSLTSDEIATDVLLGASGLSISKDGKNVYVASSDGGSVEVFGRNQNTGSLTFLDSFSETENNINGLEGTVAITVSADDQQVYVAGTGSNSLVIFNRNINTGEITYQETLVDGEQNISDLDFPVAIAVSDKFSEIYVADFGSNALLSFTRNLNEATLDFGFSERGSGLGIVGLRGAETAVISPDGNYLYVAAKEGDAVSIFARNQEDGSLSYVDYLEDGGGLDGLNGATDIIISADGTDVYIAGFWDNTVTHFNRDISTGLLSFSDKEKDGLFSVDGISGANSLVFSENENYVYVAGFWDNAIGVFSRNTDDGTLEFETAFFDGENGIDGLEGITKMILNADQTKLYALGSTEEAIAIFNINNQDGSLDYQEMVSAPGALRMEISPAADHLYTVNPTVSSVSQFGINASGGLTLEMTYEATAGGGNFNGLNNVDNLNLNSNGDLIYFTSKTENTVAAYRRDLISGNLSFEKVQRNDEANVHSIAGASSVNTSANGKFIYVTAADDNAVAVFSCTYFFKETTTVCNGITVTIAGQMYDETGVYQETIENENCITNIDLDLTVQPSEHNIAVDLCDGDIFILGDQAYNSSGIYSYDFVSSLGCDSTVTVDLTVVDGFQLINQTVEICQGDSYSIGGSSYSEEGFYEVTWPTASGCDSTVLLDLLVAPTFNTTETSVLCQGDFFVFGNQNYIQSGVYTNVFSSTQGCDSTVTLILSIYPGTTEIDAIICEGESYDFDGEFYTETGTYQGIVLSNSGCEIETTLHLEVVENITVEPTIIEDEGNGLGGIELQVLGGLPPYTYQWSNGVTIAEIHNLTPDIYEVTVTDANNCAQELSLPVNFTTGIEELNVITEVHVFPNPNTVNSPLNINLTSPNTQTIQLQIFTLLGEKILNRKESILSGSNHLAIDLPLTSGVYFLTIIDEYGQQIIQKLEML